MAYAIGNAGSDTESKADPLVDSRRGGDVASFTANRWMVHFPGSTQAYVSSKWPAALARSAIEDALVFGAKAVKADPQGVEACGLMADALASAKAPETVFWRARVALLQPDKLENYLTWAQAAFDVGRSDWAAEALVKAPNSAPIRVGRTDYWN